MAYKALSKNTLSLQLLFFLYFFVLAAWTYYRNVTRSPEIVDELLAKPVIWILPIFIVLIWKKVGFQTLSFKPVTLRLIFLSVLSGIGLSLLQIIPNILKGYEYIHIPSGLGFLLASTIGTAVYEEMFFRGFFLQQLQNYFSASIASGISAVLFMSMHIPILVFVSHLSEASLFLRLYVILASGIAYGLLYLYSKNLWYPIIAHYILDVILLVF